MTTRYSKRQANGVVEYYDSREEMDAANPATSYGDTLRVIASSFNPFLALAGFFVAGTVALWFASGITVWPAWARFTGVLCIALSGGFLFGKFGNALLMLAAVIIGGGIIFCLGYMAWHVL